MKRVFSKKNRALLAELVRTDFKLRYQGSVLGYAWSLLKPLFIFSILYVVFVNFLKFGQGFDHFAVYLLLGIILWNFFAEMTQQSLASIVGRSSLIRKIRIPRWIIIVSSSFSALINLVFNLLVVGLFMLIFGAEVQPQALIIVPLLIVELYLFGLGLSLFLSASYVKYRDIKYIWDIVMQAGFYATPIIYLLSRVPEEMHKFLLISPIAQVIQGARYQLVNPEAVTINDVFDGGVYSLIPVSIVVVVLILGAMYFKKESRDFAENI